MAIDPQRMAAILQRVQLARQGGAGGAPPSGPMGSPPPDMPMGGPPPGMPPQGAPQGVPMQIQGVMSPMPGGPQGLPQRPMMPPGGMPPR
jgi:hypothetical protein